MNVTICLEPSVSEVNETVKNNNERIDYTSKENLIFIDQQYKFMTFIQETMSVYVQQNGMFQIINVPVLEDSITESKTL